MMNRGTPRQPPVASTPEPELDPTGAERVAVLLRWIFGDKAPEKYGFGAGDVLIEEGESVGDRPALLLVEGEIEECVASFTPETGQGEHTVHVAQTGDMVNVQALVPPYDEAPAQCSLHANTDGWCYLVWRAQVEHIPELTAALELFYVKWAEALERLRSMAVESEELHAHVRELERTRPSAMSARAVIDEWEEGKLTDAERKLEELQDELERAQVSVSQARQRTEETQKKLDLERRARAALEQRVLELMQRVADQTLPPSDEKFPTAIRILESAELEEMESEARRHREMAADYVERARMLHRAFEMLAVDNPGLVIKPAVMQLMMGEEPEPTEEERELQAARDRRATLPFMTAPASAPHPSSDAIPGSPPLPTMGGSPLVPGKNDKGR